MLRKLAVALVAASVFAAPVLAETSSTGNQTPAAKPAVTAPAAPAKAAAPTNAVKHIKKNRHTGKQVRHGSHGTVAKVHGKNRTGVKASALKGVKLVAHKGSQTGTVR